jgi:hypothetical protein
MVLGVGISFRATKMCYCKFWVRTRVFLLCVCVCVCWCRRHSTSRVQHVACNKDYDVCSLKVRQFGFTITSITNCRQ